MPGFRLSREAKADLKSIARDTERKWGREKRREYLAQLDQCFHLLGKTPYLGQPCDNIRPGYRRYSQGSHITFYRQAADGTVEIIRVLHKRMQPDSHL